MTLLKPPTVRAQLSASTHPFDDCGEADCASAITDAGTNVSVEQVASWAQSSGNSYSNGETDGSQLAAILRHWGVPAAVRYSPLSQTIPAALARSHEVIVLIDSNDYGIPSPGSGIGHWLLVYGDQSSAYQVMQPLGGDPGGMLTQYGQSGLQAADQQQAVEVMEVLPKDGAPAPPPPPPGQGQGGTRSAAPGAILPAVMLLGGGGAVAWWELHRNQALRSRLTGDLRAATRRLKGVF